MKYRIVRALPLAILFASFLTTTIAAAQRATPRITEQINPNQRVTLQGNTPPQARAAFDRGPAPDSMMEGRMLLVLSRTDAQEKALRQLLDDQQTAGSPNFHKWLTPEEFGQQFGPADTDVQAVTTWLLNNGFQVDEVSPGKNVIEFSGTVGQLRQVFHTDVHKYVVNGNAHWANSNDPQIPAALAPVVSGIASLNDFRRRPHSHTFNVMKRDIQTGETTPLITTGGADVYYPIGPADFSVIYGSSSLLQTGNNGTGQTIAIVGRTNVNLQDVTDFRTLFSLPMTPDNHTSVVLNGPDPGIVPGDETESLLDLEWAGAVAPGASIVLVASESTTAADGVDLSALYIVQHNLASVMSMSYGACEAGLGNAGNLFYQSLWEQAAAQGITVSISAGDNGSAGCDDPNSETVASRGIAVNGIASTPFNIAVGGTDFNDSATQTTYFNSTNGAGYLSAKSYIPEMTWNDSCAGGTSPTTGSCTTSQNLQLWSGAGGPSNCSTVNGGTCSGTAKPAWQTGAGVPNDGRRDVPDISFFAEGGGSASRSFYLMCEADLLPVGYTSCTPSGGYVYYIPVGGTSAGAPAFAGVVALANQKLNNRRLGNLNYLFYSIAAQSGSSCSTSSTSTSCVFRDVATGANTVPCKGGTPNCSASTGNGVLVDSGKLAYITGTGYDRATGLGSPNIANLINKIGLASFTPTTTSLTLNGITTTVQANHGAPINIAVNVAPTAATGDVSLIGNNGTTDNLGIDSFKLTSGAATWSSTLFPGGTYTVHAHYAGDGTRGASDSSAISVNIAPENSKTFVNLVTFDLGGNLTSFAASSAEYGSPYILRMDVGDSAATISSSTGVSSKCTNGTASCPTGTLTVTANGNPLDGGNWKLNSQGHAEDQPIQLTAGNYNVVANYPGDASYNASSGSATITISNATTTLTAMPANGPYQYGTGFLITGTLTSTSNGAAPGGSITLLDNGVNAGSNLQLNYYFPSPGSVTSSAGAIYSARYTPPSLGSHTLTAQYTGDANYASSAATAFTVTVSQANMTGNGYNISPSVATPTIPVTLSVNFSSASQIGTPTGTIIFSDGGTPISGTVTYSSQIGHISGTMTVNFTQTGQHTITATYSGDTYYSSATQQLGILNVSDKLTSTMQSSSSLNPALVNYSTTLTATIQPPTFNLPTPTGTVTFSDNGQPLSGTVTYTGSYIVSATMPFTFTSSGTHTITANYSGDGIYAAATSSLSLSVVDKFTTTPYFTEPVNLVANTPFTISVNVQSSAMFQGPVMTGTVTFKDGDTQISGTPTAYNHEGYMVVEMPYTFTTVGAHTITAQYGGDDHYAASSNAFSIQVMGPLGLQLQSNNLQMGASGGPGSANIWVYNNTSSSQNVTFTCKSDSVSATCSVNPNPIAVFANQSNIVSLNFTVPALTGSIHHNRPFQLTFVFAGILAGLCFVGRRKRVLAASLTVTALSLTMISCGGGGSGSPPPPPPQQSATYKFTVTGTAGANTDSQVLTVTVQR